MKRTNVPNARDVRYTAIAWYFQIFWGRIPVADVKTSEKLYGIVNVKYAVSKKIQGQLM